MNFEKGYEKRDTNRRRRVHAELVSQKDPEKLKWMGDKFPQYTKSLGLLSENNPGANFIITYRPVEEVAESFEARSKNPEDAWLGGKDGFKLGIEDWNRAMRRTRDFIESGVNPNVLVVSYHDFFHRNEECIPLISRYLDLEFDDAVRSTWNEASQEFENKRRSKEPLDEEKQSFIEKHADREAEAWILDRIEKQWDELELYPPEAARALIEERRQFAIRFEKERSRDSNQELRQQVGDSEDQLNKEQNRVASLQNENQQLESRVRNLEKQIQAVQSSRTWRVMSVLSRMRAGLLGTKDNGTADGHSGTGTALKAVRSIKHVLGSSSGVLRSHAQGRGTRAPDRAQNLDQQNRLDHLDHVIWEGIALPPSRLRPNGKRKKNSDEVYLESARWEVDWMVENLGLSVESSFLDIGCGPGRIAIGILDRVGKVHKYRGVDVKKKFIDWARHYITSEHPNFQFLHLDAENAFYNPQGEKMSHDFVLPFAKDEFDIIWLYSVFTHMLTEDVRIYLKEIHRVLRPSGKVFLTANLEEDVPNVTENPKGYRGRWSYNNPLATVRYNQQFFESLLDQNGFRLERYDPRVRKPQRCLIVSKKASSQ